MKKLWVAAVLLSGCSFFVVQGPGNWTPENKRAPVCDDTAALPVALDLFIAAMGGGGLGAGISGGDSDSPLDTSGRIAAGSVGGALLIGGLISAYIGITNARECRAAEATWIMQR